MTRKKVTFGSGSLRVDAVGEETRKASVRANNRHGGAQGGGRPTPDDPVVAPNPSPIPTPIPAAPTFSALSIGGTAADGETLTAVYTQGGGAPNEAPRIIWNRNGAELLNGQSSPTITLDEALQGWVAGDTLGFDISASNSGGTGTGSAETAYTGGIPIAEFDLVGIDTSADEGGDRVLKFEVSASGAPFVDTTVSWRAKGDGTGSTATPQRLVGGEGGEWPTGSVIFPAGLSANQAFTVTLADDAIFQDDEGLIVEIYAVAPSGTIGTAEQACTVVSDDAAPTLGTLGGTFSLPEDAAEGALAGAVTGRTPGSTLTLADDAGGRLTIDSATGHVRRGATALDYETNASHDFTVDEALSGATGSPNQTVLTLAVTDVAEGVAPALSNSSISGTAQDGQILTALYDVAGNPAPTVTYQWKRNGSNISGQTARTITLNAAGMSLADGDTISCAIGATNAYGSDSATPTTAFAAGGAGIQSVQPSAAYNGTAGSGFGTEPTPSSPRALTDPAKPALLPFFGDRVAFTNTHRVYFGAAAIDTDGTLLNTLGVSKVTFQYEGGSVDVTAPAIHTYTDVNGTSRKVYGWACDFKHNGVHGEGKYYVTSWPRHGAMLPRVMGPYYLYPSAAATQGTLEIAATPAEIVGARYRTPSAAAQYAASQGWHTVILEVTQTATYSPVMSGPFFANKGRLIIRGTVPFTIAGSGTVYNFGTYTSGYIAGLTDTSVNYARVEYQGANCTVDYRFLKPFIAGRTIYFNGCNVIHSGGRGERWAMGPRQFVKLGHGTVWLQDCQINGMSDPGKQADAVVNCALPNGCGDIFSGAGMIWGNVVSNWGKDQYTWQNAFKVHFTGTGTPTMDYVSSASSGRDIVLKVNGSEVGRYNIKGGEANFLSLHNTGNFRFSHLVAYINSRAGWVASLDDDSIRAQYMSRLNEKGLTFTGHAISKSSTARTQFYHFIDMHSDWMSQGGRSENVIAAMNKATNMKGCIPWWLGNPTAGPRDYIAFNNVWEGASFINPPFQQFRAPGSHVVTMHCSWADQDNKLASGWNAVSHCVYATCTFPKFNESTSGALGTVADCHVHTSSYIEVGTTGFTAGGSKATCFANAAGGDFTPTGALAANLKPRRVAFDINYATRAALEPAGAVRKP